MKQVKFLVILAMTFIVIGCQKDELSIPSSTELNSSVPQAWVTTALDLVKNTPGFTPPVAARTYAYLGLAMYEAARYGTIQKISLAGQLDGLTAQDIPPAPNQELYWDEVTNSAAHEILKACLVGAKAENQQLLENRYNALAAFIKTDKNEALFAQSSQFGKLVGDAIVKFATSDGQTECYSTNFPSNYIVPKGDGYWEPVGNQSIPLQPYWGNVRTFAKDIKSIVVAPPPPFSTANSSKFYTDAKEVNDVFLTLNERQSVIAAYWSDDPGITSTPPGHSISIASQVLVQEKSNLSTYTEVMAKMGMAMHDAFVSCWKTKYEFNLLRPVTYINRYINPNFKTFLNTPPFPEYTSGHSVQSGAAAGILNAEFGLNYKFTDKTHQFRTDINGSPRTFLSFDDFADEAALSRLYGGIHYTPAIVEGVAEGKKVANEILKLKFDK